MEEIVRIIARVTTSKLSASKSQTVSEFAAAARLSGRHIWIKNSYNYYIQLQQYIIWKTTQWSAEIISCKWYHQIWNLIAFNNKNQIWIAFQMNENAIDLARIRHTVNIVILQLICENTNFFPEFRTESRWHCILALRMSIQSQMREWTKWNRVESLIIIILASICWLYERKNGFYLRFLSIRLRIEAISSPKQISFIVYHKAWLGFVDV